jgi:hypothetical protein
VSPDYVLPAADADMHGEVVHPRWLLLVLVVAGRTCWTYYPYEAWHHRQQHPALAAHSAHATATYSAAAPTALLLQLLPALMKRLHLPQQQQILLAAVMIRHSRDQMC